MHDVSCCAHGLHGASGSEMAPELQPATCNPHRLFPIPRGLWALFHHPQATQTCMHAAGMQPTVTACMYSEYKTMSCFSMPCMYSPEHCFPLFVSVADAVAVVVLVKLLLDALPPVPSSLRLKCIDNVLCMTNDRERKNSFRRGKQKEKRRCKNLHQGLHGNHVRKRYPSCMVDVDAWGLHVASSIVARSRS